VGLFKRAQVYAETQDPTQPFEANLWGGDRVILEALVPAEHGEMPVFFQADILVTNGDPLQALTWIDRMFIGGVEVDPRDNKHDRLYREFVNRR